MTEKALLEPYALYSVETARSVIDAYASGRALRDIANMPGMPCRMTIRAWERERPDFCTALAHAREAKAEVMAEDGLAIVDACDGTSSSQVQKAREQGAYRRWLAGCLDPGTYGDKSNVSVQVQGALVLGFASALGSMSQVEAPADATVSTPVPPA